MSTSLEHAEGDPILVQRGVVTYVNMPTPSMGGKTWVLNKRGIFVLETGPGLIRTIACTHAGAGSLLAHDGCPDEDGFFPESEYDEDHPLYHMRPGRYLYKAHPAVMGSWMIEGGYFHGLTLVATGGHNATVPVATVVWIPDPNPESARKKVEKQMAELVARTNRSESSFT